MEYIYRAAYEWPDGKRGRITFLARSDKALQFAAGYVKFFCKGYLLSLVEERAAERNLELM